MKTTLLIVFLFSLNHGLAQDNNFKPGRYYDKKGKKNEGYLDVSRILKHLEFKSLEESEIRKIKTSKILSLVVENDSFAIIKDFKVESDHSNKLVVVKIGTGKVLEEGKVYLYQIFYRGEDVAQAPYTGASAGPGRSGGYHHVYAISPNGTGKVATVERDINDFVEQMILHFGMSPEISQRIKNKEYSYLKMPELVRDFNEWYRNR